MFMFVPPLFLQESDQDEEQGCHYPHGQDFLPGNCSGQRSFQEERSKPGAEKNRQAKMTPVIIDLSAGEVELDKTAKCSGKNRVKSWPGT